MPKRLAEISGAPSCTLFPDALSCALDRIGCSQAQMLLALEVQHAWQLGVHLLLQLPLSMPSYAGSMTRVGELLEVLDKADRLGADIAHTAAGASGARDGSLRSNARLVARPAAPAAPRLIQEPPAPVLPTAETAERAGPAASIRFDGVSVVTPAGKLLARQLSVEVVPGRSLLVTGPNGAGKTSLLRLLGGLWPLPPGDGAIVRPAAAGKGEAESIYYVPQRPYTTGGTLRDQLLYPLTQQQALARWQQAGKGGARQQRRLPAATRDPPCRNSTLLRRHSAEPLPAHPPATCRPRPPQPRPRPLTRSWTA